MWPPGTFMAKKRDRPKNFGCVVRPMAATAEEPKEDTIKESISPVRAVKKDSRIAGQAIWRVVLSNGFCVISFSLIFLLLYTYLFFMVKFCYTDFMEQNDLINRQMRTKA